jgi:probable HAF family extracellular repeat protein
MMQSAAVFVLLATLIAPVQQPAPMSYRVTDLGVLKGAWFQASAINNKGVIAGRLDYGDWQKRLATWSKGKLRNLEAGVDYESWADPTAISDSGTIVGFRTSSGAITVADCLLWKNGKDVLIDVGESWYDKEGFNHRNDSGCTDINAKGWICGSAEQPGGPQAFIWKNGKATYLKSPTPGFGNAINAAGDVAGYLRSSMATTDEAPCLWRGGKLIRLKTLGGGQGTAVDISDSGLIVGTTSDTQRRDRATLWDRDLVAGDLGTLGGWKSGARGINNAGVIVGYAQDVKGKKRAVVWINAKITDLNSLLPGKSGWVLQEAVAINERGQIIGQGLHNRRQRSFLLDPVPPKPAPPQPKSGTRLNQ